jgi:hypothetical protein
MKETIRRKSRGRTGSGLRNKAGEGWVEDAIDRVFGNIFGSGWSLSDHMSPKVDH